MAKKPVFHHRATLRRYRNGKWDPPVEPPKEEPPAPPPEDNREKLLNNWERIRPDRFHLSVANIFSFIQYSPQRMLWYWAVSIDRNRHRYGYKKTQRLAMERATQEVCDLIGWYPVIDETEEINIRDIA